MRRSLTNSRSVYLIGGTLLVLVLAGLWAGQLTSSQPSEQPQSSQAQLAVPAAVGTLVVLPTLPPIAAVPSVGPNALTFAPGPTMAPTAVPTALIANQQNPVRILGHEIFSSWSYTTHQVSNEQPFTEIKVDMSSAATIQTFAAANKQYAKQLAQGSGTVVVRVVFRRVLDLAQYRLWVKTSGISQFDDVCLPATDKMGGPSGMMCLSPGSSDPLPATPLALAEKDLRDMQGVGFVKGQMPANALLALVADPQVVLVDLTDNIVRQHLSAAGVANANTIVVGSNLSITTARKLLGQEK